MQLFDIFRNEFKVSLTIFTRQGLGVVYWSAECGLGGREGERGREGPPMHDE